MSEGTAVLDHGYVRLIETWGSDERIIEAARMSVDKGFEGWGPKDQCQYCGAGTGFEKGECAANGDGHRFGPFGPPGDEKLLRFLWENRHTTPFEMAGAIFEIKAPIFVFREWHRHRTQSYNEMSARYVPLPDENYVPTLDRVLVGGSTNKQAQGTGAALDVGNAQRWRYSLTTFYAEAQALYESGLAYGVPKELARLCVPVARYSRMRASAVLKNWLDFLTLRDDSKAQWEIQQYAAAVRAMLAERFPRTLELYTQKRERATALTEAATAILSKHAEHDRAGYCGACSDDWRDVWVGWPCDAAKVALLALGRTR